MVNYTTDTRSYPDATLLILPPGMNPSTLRIDDAVNLCSNTPGCKGFTFNYGMNGGATFLSNFGNPGPDTDGNSGLVTVASDSSTYILLLLTGVVVSTYFLLGRRK